MTSSNTLWFVSSPERSTLATAFGLLTYLLVGLAFGFVLIKSEAAS